MKTPKKTNRSTPKGNRPSFDLKMQSLGRELTRRKIGTAGAQADRAVKGWNAYGRSKDRT